jgi:hypothetical protein
MTAWDDSFANTIKARIDAGQEVDPADAQRFEAMVTTAVNDLHRRRAP